MSGQSEESPEIAALREQLAALQADFDKTRRRRRPTPEDTRKTAERAAKAKARSEREKQLREKAENEMFAAMLADPGARRNLLDAASGIRTRQELDRARMREIEERNRQNGY